MDLFIFSLPATVGATASLYTSNIAAIGQWIQVDLVEAAEVYAAELLTHGGATCKNDLLEKRVNNSV